MELLRVRWLYRVQGKNFRRLRTFFVVKVRASSVWELEKPWASGFSRQIAGLLLRNLN